MDNKHFPDITLQSEYLEAMQLGSGRAADRVVERALDVGVAAGDVYLDIFQPTAYEIGRLWQANKFTVAQEHLAIAIIERQMGELHSLFKPQQQRHRTAVIGCVPKEQHRVGVRMVADFFEEDGWEVHYLGATTPVASLAAVAKETQADLIGLSVSMFYHLPYVVEFTKTLAQSGLEDIPIMVGGLPFVQQPELANGLNIQFSAIDAREAVRKANALFAQPTPISTPLYLPTATAAQAAAVLERRCSQIINAATAQALEDRDEIALLGDQAASMFVAGFEAVTRTIETALLLQNTELVERQLVWFNERQAHDGAALERLANHLAIYSVVIEDVLPADIAQIVNHYVRWMINRQNELIHA